MDANEADDDSYVEVWVEVGRRRGGVERMIRGESLVGRAVVCRSGTYESWSCRSVRHRLKYPIFQALLVRSCK